jgi:hypothetical protein
MVQTPACEKVVLNEIDKTVTFPPWLTRVSNETH